MQRPLEVGLVTWTHEREGVRVWGVDYPSYAYEELTWPQLREVLLPARGAAAGGGAVAAPAPLRAPAAAPDGGASDDEESDGDGRAAAATHVAGLVTPAVRHYRGVHRLTAPNGRVDWRAELKVGGRWHTRGCADALSAAHAFDDMARQHGITAVNFPDASAGETQAVPQQHVASARDAARAAAASLPAEQRFKGVGVARMGKVWQVSVRNSRTRRMEHLGKFDDAVEAARAFDKRARQLGIKKLNFPRPGTNETQGVYRP